MVTDSQEISTDVAIVGAGVSGSYCAAVLARDGLDVLLMEKARGSGGRLSSKRMPVSENYSVTVDLGASNFDLTHDAIRSDLSEFVGDDLVLVTGTSRYLATPRNSLLTRKMLSRVQTLFATRAQTMSKTQAGWQISATDRDGAECRVFAKRVIVTAPPAQASELLPKGHCLKSALAGVKMRAQWVAIMVFERSDAIDEQALATQVRRLDGVHSITLEAEKPGRELGKFQALVIQMTPEWTQARIDSDKHTVLDELLSQVLQCDDAPQIEATHIHRWLYSLPPEAGAVRLPVEVTDGSFWDEQGLGVCGDYMSDVDEEGVQRACLSARSLLDKMRQSLSTCEAPE